MQDVASVDRPMENDAGLSVDAVGEGLPDGGRVRGAAPQAGGTERGKAPTPKAATRSVARQGKHVSSGSCGDIPAPPTETSGLEARAMPAGPIGKATRLPAVQGFRAPGFICADG